MARFVQPSGFEEAAAALAEAARQGESVRIRGAGTKLGWGHPVPAPDLELHTAGLDAVLEHNVGDFTAVLQAGVPLARAQELFAAEGQTLALDPPLGHAAAATVGGVVAAGDCGPLRHRYGAPRDLVLGMTVALSDGTIARSGGRVIKNVAGYDLAKLFAGSFGTLGMILSVSVRLHPLPVQARTALGAGSDPGALSAAALALARAPLELEALDVAWRGGRGGILARVAGAAAPARARRVAAMLAEAGLEQIDVAEPDDTLWERQRAGQRARDGYALVRISHRPSQLAGALAAAEAAAATLIARAALGTSYVEVEPEALEPLRAAAPAGARLTLLDAPAGLRGAGDPWGSLPAPALELMRRVKDRFDPAHACNPGLLVGGI